MSRDDIIAMAREAGFDWDDLGVSDRLCFARFAALVAAAECEALVEGMTARARWVRGGINATPAEPCQYAAAIRRGRGKP